MRSQHPPGTRVVWIDDGDLMLKVTRDEQIIVHRVHACIMRLHSEVFRDMLALSPGNNQEMVGSCPVVQLHDDPEDIFLLLRTLFRPGTSRFRKLRQRTFDELEPLLRLADKYQMHDLTSQLLPSLEQDWPKWLQAWDINEAEVKIVSDITERGEKLFDEYDEVPRLDDLLPEPCRVIRLARECSFYSVLPAAFYHLSRLSLDKDDKQGEELVRKGARRAAKKHLVGEDWVTLYNGQLGMRNWGSTVIARLKDGLRYVYAMTSQNHNDQCRELMISFIAELENKLCLPSPNSDPLRTLKEYQLLPSYNKQCHDCQWATKWLGRDAREELWKLLPSLFRLESDN